MTTISTALHVAAGYEPGHISERYGNGCTTLFSLVPETPAHGDLSVDLTANGEWRFIIRRADGEPSRITGDYSNPDDITPEIEALVADTSDGESISFDEHEHRIEWVYNNWFECFTLEYDAEDGLWHEVGFDVVNLDRGPSLPDASTLLRTMLAEAYKAQGVEATIVCRDAVMAGDQQQA